MTLEQKLATMSYLLGMSVAMNKTMIYILDEARLDGFRFKELMTKVEETYLKLCSENEK